MWETRVVRYVNGKVCFKEIYFNFEHKVQSISTKNISVGSAKTINELFTIINKLNVALSKPIVSINEKTGEIIEGKSNVGYSSTPKRKKSSIAL